MQSICQICNYDLAQIRTPEGYHEYMTTATAQENPNLVFAKLSQWNTVFGNRRAGFVHI
jgi:hypothetical protein